MKLFLVRHGESTWNVEGRYQGRQDPPLSPRGRAQAQALALRLRIDCDPTASREPVPAIVSSPLARARDTALVCAGALSLRVGVDERLTEISHGDWEGKRRDEIARLWPDMFAAWQMTPHLVKFTGGESLGDVQARLESFLVGLLDRELPLLAITHDVLVRLAIVMAEKKPISALNETRVDNAALNEFSLEFRSESCSGRACSTVRPLPILTAIRINDTRHLGSLRSDTLTQAL